LVKDRKEAERVLAEYEEKLHAACLQTFDDSSTKEVFELTIDGKKHFAPGTGYSMDRLLMAFCVHLTNFDNPFKNSYTPAQRTELITSIMGSNVPNTGTAANPTPYSFE